MSKPKAINFVLDGWSIEYETQYFDSDRRGELHYMAHIRWVANWGEESMVPPKFMKEQEMFTTLAKAKEWIDKEITS